MDLRLIPWAAGLNIAEAGGQAPGTLSFTPGRIPTVRVPGADGLAEALRGLGIPPDEDALRAAQGLVAAGQPLTAARVRAVIAALRRLPAAPADPARVAWAAAVLLARGLPPGGPLLAALLFHARGAPSFGPLVAALAEAFTALQEAAGRGEPAAAGAGSPLRKPPLDADSQGTGSLSPALVQGLQSLLRRLTLPGNAPSGGTGAPADGGGSGGEGEAQLSPSRHAAEGLAHRLERAVRALGLDHERGLVRQLLGQPGPGAAGQVGGEPTTLKGMLLALRHALRAAGAGEPVPAGADGEETATAYGQALARAEEVLQALTAWQALSAEPEEAGAPERRTVVFQLPVAFGSAMGTVDVAVERPARRRPGREADGGPQGGEGGGEGGDPGGYTVRLRLDPPHIGAVRVELFLRERRLGVGFAAREEALAALAEGAESLGERLRRVGFEVEGIGFRPLPAEEGAGVPRRAPPTTGIDLRL